jgi:hypothetical protein
MFYANVLCAMGKMIGSRETSETFLKYCWRVGKLKKVPGVLSQGKSLGDCRRWSSYTLSLFGSVITY